MRLLVCMFLLLPAHAFANCESRDFPPGMGGVVDTVLDNQTLKKWHDFREARVEERMQEVLTPERIRQTYRISQEQIKQGCVNTEQLVDLGRALFMREFTLNEGLGGGIEGVPRFQRFQRKDEVSAHATSCTNCHWKGGFAGAGDKVDNTFLEGDGDKIGSHLQRNPIALLGLGWVELLAREMSQSLQQQKQTLIIQAQKNGKAKKQLSAKGISFGELSATFTIDNLLSIDTSKLEGVDESLVIKPFGWQGRYAKLSDMVRWSFQSHLGLTNSEISDGQVSSVTAFLATLATPIIEVPVVAGLRPDKYIPLAEAKPTFEFASRWPLGQKKFEEIGCAVCHKPFLDLNNDKFDTVDFEISLQAQAAKPKPERINEHGEVTLVTDEFSKNRVYLFSDLKQHDMGYGRFLTRPLWGLRNSAPYSFDGGSNVIDQVMQKHQHQKSSARGAALRFGQLKEKRKADLRVFLYSLMRKPEIRVR